MVEKKLNLGEAACEEMDRIDQLYFNIFHMQEFTHENELVAVTSYILAKHDIFSKVNLSFDTFLHFIKQIQGGYKKVAYHNKTHAADLCQVSSNII